MSPFQVKTVTLIGLAILLDGFDSNILSLAVPSLSRIWHLPPKSFAAIAALASAAMLIGAPLAGIANDRIGRRKTLIASTCLYGAASLSGSFAHSFDWLLYCRLLSGFGLGGALVAATTSISEHTPSTKRALVVTLAVLGMPLGSTLSGLASSALIEPFGWKALFVVGGVGPLLLATYYLLFLPETPIYLHWRADRTALERYFKRNGAPLAADIIVEDGSEGDRQRGNPMALLSNGLRRDTLLIWLATFSSLLSCYMMLNWLPVLYTNAGAGPRMASASISWFGAGSLLGGLVSPLLVLRYGSRLVMIPAAATAVVLSAALAIFFDVNPTGVIALCALALMSSMFSILNILLYSVLPNVYPDRIRGSGIGFAVGAGRVGAIASAYVGVYALRGGGKVFFGLSAAAAVVALVCYSCLKRHSPRGQWSRGAARIQWVQR